MEAFGGPRKTSLFGDDRNVGLRLQNTVIQHGSILLESLADKNGSAFVRGVVVVSWMLRK
jgi:hypothetical protein